MNAQHTPAPWYWSDNVPDFPKNHCIIVDADGFTIAEPSPMGEADARLIAAAPELLAALEWAVDQLDDDPYPDYSAALDAARAVIAKAKGETA